VFEAAKNISRGLCPRPEQAIKKGALMGAFFVSSVFVTPPSLPPSTASPGPFSRDVMLQVARKTANAFDIFFATKRHGVPALISSVNLFQVLMAIFCSGSNRGRCIDVDIVKAPFTRPARGSG